MHRLCRPIDFSYGDIRTLRTYETLTQCVLHKHTIHVGTELVRYKARIEQIDIHSSVFNDMQGPCTAVSR